MGKAALQWLRRRRAFAIAGFALVAGATCFVMWPEPADVRVRRLLAELHGEPPVGFRIFPGQRSHEQIHAELDRLGAKATPELLETLEHSPLAPRRVFAIEQLSKLRDARAVPLLIRSLEDPDPSVQRLAASALGELQAHAAIDPLIACLESGDSSLRTCAAVALGKIGDPRAVEALVPLVRDGDVTVRAFTVEALVQLGAPSAVEPLIAALEHDESPWVRGLAIKGLLQLGDDRAVPALRAASREEAGHVRDEARRALPALVRKRRNRKGKADSDDNASDAPSNSTPP